MVMVTDKKPQPFLYELKTEFRFYYSEYITKIELKFI